MKYNKPKKIQKYTKYIVIAIATLLLTNRPSLTNYFSYRYMTKISQLVIKIVKYFKRNLKYLLTKSLTAIY